MCVMFFNVEEVQAFLTKYRFVYTLRKRRKRIGSDIGVVGRMFKYKTFGKIYIDFIGRINRYEELIPFVEKSGLFPKKCSVIKLALGVIHREVAKSWFLLAKKLSGEELYLYKVTLTEPIPARDEKDAHQRMDDRLKRLSEAGKKLTGGTAQPL